PKGIFIIAGATFIVFALSLYNRYIYIDDAWFGEQAYWLAQCGLVKVETIKGFHGWDTHLLAYHKLSIIIGALLIKVFGWSVNVLRIFSLAVYVFFFVVLSGYYRNNRNNFSPDHFILAAFVIFFNPLTLLYSFTFRPEMMVSVLGFSSFFFLDLYFIKSPKFKFVAFAGLLAGLAFFTNLNGMVFGITGFFVLALMKKLKAAFVFGIFTALTASLYFYDLWQPGNFQLFLYQIKNWPVPHASNYTAVNFWDFVSRVITKLSQEHQRFFWSYKVWGISALFIFALILKFRKIKQLKPHLALYILFLILSLNLFGSQIAERFLIYFLPYMAIVISVLLVDLKTDTRQWAQALTLFLLVLQLACVSYLFYDIFKQNDNYVEQHSRIMSEIPDQTSPVLVSYRFVFNELEKRPLVTYKGFEYHEVALGRKMEQDEFYLRASQLGIQYIIVPPEMLTGSDTRFPFLREGKTDNNTLYERYYSGFNYRILKHK
nr:hypothetical protein [Bacteroidota bacterium]